MWALSMVTRHQAMISQSDVTRFSWVVQGRKPSSSTPELLDQQEIALNLCFGKASVQLQLTRGKCRALTADAVADIWKASAFTFGL